MQAIIEYKTKIKTDSNGNEFFAHKQKLTKSDIVNIKDCCGHWAINSDLMTQVINRGLKKALNINNSNIPTIISLNEIPACFEVKRGFLSIISIKIDI